MIEALWSVTNELAPWLLLGAAVAGAMHAFLPPGAIARWLSGRLGVWKSVLVGVPMPLCSCAVIPVGLGLKRQGASDGAAVAFLIATPQTGVDSILVTAGLLGWPLALFKVVTAIVTGAVGGWLTDATAKRTLSLPIVDEPVAARSRSWTDRLRSGLAHADELIHAIWKWLVVGVLLSAALTVWVPTGWLTGVSAYGALAAMGAALALSLPMYVCATASVPIAASLVAGGLPLGAVIVFLMAGPATNAATIGAVYRGIGRRATWAYLVTIIAGSIAGGWLFEALIDVDASTVAAHGSHDHEGGAWRNACSVVLIAWLARCAYRDASGEPSAH